MNVLRITASQATQTVGEYFKEGAFFNAQEDRVSPHWFVSIEVRDMCDSNTSPIICAIINAASEVPHDPILYDHETHERLN